VCDAVRRPKVSPVADLGDRRGPHQVTPCVAGERGDLQYLLDGGPAQTTNVMKGASPDPRLLRPRAELHLALSAGSLATAVPDPSSAASSLRLLPRWTAAAGRCFTSAPRRGRSRHVVAEGICREALPCPPRCCGRAGVQESTAAFLSQAVPPTPRGGTRHPKNVALNDQPVRRQTNAARPKPYAPREMRPPAHVRHG
jgi:hypothetical protein